MLSKWAGKTKWASYVVLISKENRTLIIISAIQFPALLQGAFVGSFRLYAVAALGHSLAETMIEFKHA